MASATFFPHRPSLGSDLRLGLALLASALLHGLMVLSLPRYSIHDSVFTRPVQAPLSVRINALPETPEAAPIVIAADRKSAFRRKATAPVPAAPSPPVRTLPSQPGVTIAETLSVPPIPARVMTPLLESGEFLRVTDSSEKPELVTMRIPAYPRAAQDEKLAGWVTVMLLVDESGKVVETAAVQSSEFFSTYAAGIADEMRDSTFIPGKRDGRAVKTMMFVTVRFDIRGLVAPASSAPVESEKQGTQ